MTSRSTIFFSGFFSEIALGGSDSDAIISMLRHILR